VAPAVSGAGGLGIDRGLAQPFAARLSCKQTAGQQVSKVIRSGHLPSRAYKSTDSRSRARPSAMRQHLRVFSATNTRHAASRIRPDRIHPNSPVRRHRVAAKPRFALCKPELDSR
jgi:hypothetical protein